MITWPNSLLCHNVNNNSHLCHSVNKSLIIFSISVACIRLFTALYIVNNKFYITHWLAQPQAQWERRPSPVCSFHDTYTGLCPPTLCSLCANLFQAPGDAQPEVVVWLESTPLSVVENQKCYNSKSCPMSGTPRDISRVLPQILGDWGENSFYVSKVNMSSRYFSICHVYISLYSHLPSDCCWYYFLLELYVYINTNYAVHFA